jgi:dihydropyrimidinase
LFDLVVSNGTVVLPEGKTKMDIGIRDGRVASLAEVGELDKGDAYLDASGMYVFPGFIDAHVHVNQPLGEFVTNDQFEDATRAAAFGGTTTIVDFAIPDPGESPLEAFERKLNEAEGNAYIDFSLHACLTKTDRRSMKQIPELLHRGVGTFKMFMVYKDRLLLTPGEIRDAMFVLSRHGGTALVHAEDPGIIDHLVEQQLARGEKAARAHVQAHPDRSEVTAMWTVVTLVKETGCPTYFVHVSAGEAGDVLRYAQEKKLPLRAETCPHYLSLSEELYGREDASNYVCSPPLRSTSDTVVLWRLIHEGLIQVVNSDHCGYDTGQKSRFADDFTKIPNGLPGVETKNVVLYSEGVGSGRLTPEEFVALTSTNMAKLLGVYPQKGTVSVGSDADLVIFDPSESWTVSASDLHMQTDYSPFEGFELKGKPVTTIVRGVIVVREGHLDGTSDHGRFIPTFRSEAKKERTEEVE